jgi:cobalt-zinc-cadmium efflux system membrane fusion protein
MTTTRTSSAKGASCSINAKGTARAGLPLIAALLLSACSGAEAPPPPAKPQAPGVISFAPGSEELDSLVITRATTSPLPISADLNARLVADEAVTARIGAPVSGRITAIRADLGTTVRRGQVLAVMAAPDIADARADVLKAQADADLKSRAAARASDLFKGEAIARRDVESATADRLAAAAELTRARDRLRDLGGGSGAALPLTSPIAGFVIDRQITPGQQISAGQGPLFTVTDPTHLWLLIDVPETAASRARVGEDVEFDVAAWPGRHFRARIARVALAVDPLTRRVQVRADVANPDLALKPEMFARARLVTDDGRTAIKVPNAALFEQGARSYAFRQEAPGRFRRVPVTVGVRGDSDSFVTQGLKNGDTIVGEGALLLNAQLAGN